MSSSQRIALKRASREAGRAAVTFRPPRDLEQFVATQVEQGLYRTREVAIVAAVANAERPRSHREADAKDLRVSQ